MVHADPRDLSQVQREDLGLLILLLLRRSWRKEGCSNPPDLRRNASRLLRGSRPLTRRSWSVEGRRPAQRPGACSSPGPAQAGEQTITGGSTGKASSDQKSSARTFGIETAKKTARSCQRHATSAVLHADTHGTHGLVLAGSSRNRPCPGTLADASWPREGLPPCNGGGCSFPAEGR